jgi:hypothetical protein
MGGCCLSAAGDGTLADQLRRRAAGHETIVAIGLVRSAKRKKMAALFNRNAGIL